MTFRHPSNNYKIVVRHPGLWCLLFGCFYFMKHGVWTHVFISFFAALLTAGAAWFIYPFFAQGIVRHAYLSKGWIDVEAAARRQSQNALREAV